MKENKEQVSDYDLLPDEEYAYDFKDKDISIFKTSAGLSEEVVRTISKMKEEPEWMLEKRLEGYRAFMEMDDPTFGVDFTKIDWNSFVYYVKPSDRPETKWDDVPDEIRTTFQRLGIPEAERDFLAGVSTQYESEVVYQSMLKEVEDKGVIFMDTDSGLKKYPEIFKEFFGTIVPHDDNKLAALNTACWSGGAFIYIPKGVKLDRPLQSYFRINSEGLGQFERTLIIVDEGADVHYVEGCTAPIYSKDSLHSGVIEIIVHKDAKCRYTTIQNWSSNVLNLVTQRAYVHENGTMEWIDGNIGSRQTMKYPCCVLAGERAHGMVISIAVGSKNQLQDAGAKMIHLAPYTQSSIISKSVSRNGGAVNYRGIVKHDEKALYAKTKVECDTLILDDISTSDTKPLNVVNNSKSIVEHEACVTKISEEEIFYLMSRGLSEEQASETIIMGFLEPFTRELPMEYAVELNQLMRMQMEDSVG